MTANLSSLTTFSSCALLTALDWRHACWLASGIALTDFLSDLTTLFAFGHFSRSLWRLTVYTFSRTAIWVGPFGATLRGFSPTRLSSADVFPLFLKPPPQAHRLRVVRRVVLRVVRFFVVAFFLPFLYPDAVFFLPDPSGLVPLHTCTA